VIDKLVSRLDSVNKRFRGAINEIASTTDTTNKYWNGVDSKLRGLYAEARTIIKNWAENEIPKEYQSRLADTVRALKAGAIKPPNVVDYKKLVGTQTVRQNAMAILKDTLSAFDVGMRSGEKTLFHLTRVTQQTLLSDKRVNNAVADGFYEKGTGSNAKRRLKEELMAKALDGKYVTVVNKNGKSMQFEVGTYAEIVARTKLMEVSSQAVLNTAEVVGADLVQVSTHNTLCAICAQYEGKIYSLSGGDSDFPELDEEPPYHPQCQHSISIVFRKALELDGTLSDYVDFSNGDTEDHPTRRGWIPISERELH
jgi:hypothetical protein